MTQQAQAAAPAPSTTMKWEDEIAQGDDFELSPEAAEVPLACNLGEECTACQ